MGLREIWVDKKNSTNGIDGNNIDANDINDIAQAVIDLEENGTGGGGSPSDVIEFSNGIQLKVGETEEGEVIEFYNSDTKESFPLFVVDDGTIYSTIADEAFYALCDDEGNFFTEHYATKEEVGNIETALDGIIALQNSYLGVSE